MKFLCAVTAVAGGLVGGKLALATPIVNVVESTSESGFPLFTFSIDPDDFEGQYDSIGADASLGGGIFIAEGSPSSFNQGDPNDFIVAPGSDDSGLLDAGFGFSIFAGLDGSGALTGTVSSPGNNNASLVSFDIAQVVISPGNGNTLGTYGFVFADNGTPVATVTGTFGVVPEPSTLVLLGVSLGSLSLLPRRNRK